MNKFNKNTDKKFDYKQEVLDFSTDKAIEKSKKIDVENKKYDLNVVTENELIQLSGVGKSLAKNIVDFRSRIGKFEDINQLLEVKGIGKQKLIELKKVLIVK